MTDNEKMREAFGNCSLHDGYGDDMLLEENRKWFIAGWQAAKSSQMMEPVLYAREQDVLSVDDDGKTIFVSRSSPFSDWIPLYRLQNQNRKISVNEWIDKNVSGNPILIQAMKNIANEEDQ